MSVLYIPQTLATSERLTRPTILKRLALETGLGFYGTATGGSSDKTELHDTTRLKSPQYSTQRNEGAWIYMLTGSSAGDIRVIDEFIPEKGGLVVSPPFTAAIASTETYIVFFSVHPQDILDALDTLITEELYFPDWAYLTEADDGDMEQTSTTAWTGTATPSKQTTNPMEGSRYLRVTASGANEYISQTNDWLVEPNGHYHVSALYRGQDSATSGSLIVRDVTNGTTLATNTFTSPATVRLYAGNIVVPSTCYKMNVRLQTVTAGKYTEWDALTVFAEGSGKIALPWWVQNRSQVLGVFHYIDDGVVSSSANVWSANMVGRPDPGWEVKDSFGSGQLELWSPGRRIAFPMFIVGKRNQTAFSSNTEVKNLDPNLIHACLAFKVYDQLVSMPGTGQADMRPYEKAWEKYNKLRNQQVYTNNERLGQIYTNSYMREVR